MLLSVFYLCRFIKVLRFGLVDRFGFLGNSFWAAVYLVDHNIMAVKYGLKPVPVPRLISGIFPDCGLFLVCSIVVFSMFIAMFRFLAVAGNRLFPRLSRSSRCASPNWLGSLLGVDFELPLIFMRRPLNSVAFLLLLHCDQYHILS